ncbi:uncharacterized protein UDID_18701 [Ustilago sp. UG-2017a]|nr:uncharacterized protein UDID_18701 [Ustilago sp. UG-2017a]
MTDQGLNDKLDQLLALLEAQLELTRQGQREERLCRAHLSGEETIEFSPSEDQAGGGDESMIGDPHTPTPAPRPRPSVSFANLDEQDNVNYEKYASPTGPRYVKSKVDPGLPLCTSNPLIVVHMAKPVELARYGLNLLYQLVMAFFTENNCNPLIQLFSLFVCTLRIYACPGSSAQTL